MPRRDVLEIGRNAGNVLLGLHEVFNDRKRAASRLRELRAEVQRLRDARDRTAERIRKLKERRTRARWFRRW